ncbi:hypothetical protein Poli38472_004300 [Pythium oligandrum]|uniref:Annexin n=1 Tax=Pythium oligandrum TaxID=41045 RepID=A0A8K1CND9_PYTOL|nr:hypothetical protein Poli38472_004300 [Pythium oligandrum]|eukprot:TMW66535.1 hypothetical protein Poli38472_004300 [Pythium oligandrum]
MNLYPPAAHDVYNEVKLHFSSSIDSACEEIKKACKGMGTNEKALIKVLASRSPNDRSMIAIRYKELFGSELKDLLDSETSGDFGFALQLLVMPLPEAEAFILNYATSGAGTTENLIYPVLMGRTDAEMGILKRAYYEKYGKDLAVVMDSELGGDFKKVIMTAMQAPVIEYSSNFHTRAKAEEDADKLYNAGEGKWGTDEEGFLKVLLSSPFQHVREIDEIYRRKYNENGLKAAAQKEFTGEAENALVFFVRLAVETKELLADFVESTMKGMGTDETDLSAALVRYHPLLPMFESTFERKNKTTIKDRVKGEVSGDFEDLLVTLLDAPSTAPAHA